MKSHLQLLSAALVVASVSLSSCATQSRDADRSIAADGEETPWTTWSKNGTVGGLKVLKHIRENLLQNNLHDPHVTYNGYGRTIDCGQTNLRFRSADGTCTDERRPFAGAAGVAFGRNVPPAFIDRNAQANLMTPDPAEVSRTFFRRENFRAVPFLNMLAASWIQFMNHDWLTHGRNEESSPYRVASAASSSQVVERTRESTADASQYKREFGRTTQNLVTHWWDGSQIYGSSQEEQNAVRAFQGGRMRTALVTGQDGRQRELLPKDTTLDVARNKQNKGYEVTGLRDNWWLGLSMLHHLFVKEHNAIAKQLIAKHSTYDAATQTYVWKNEGETLRLNAKEFDEHVFQTARLVNSAVMAKIHTIEWTPAILANDTLKKAMYANWFGVANPQTWLPALRNVPLLNRTNWFEGINSGYLTGGVVGDRRNDYGVPFSITEEFTSVYRLHSLLPEHLELKKLANRQALPKRIPFPDSRNDKAYGLMANNDLSDLFYSFGTQKPGQLVLNNYPNFMQRLPIPGHGTMDLGMVDILRDRERGVPRYNQFRRAIGLKPIQRYSDFFPAGEPLDSRRKDILDKFDRVYGKDAQGNDNVEMIDLLVGTLSEEVRPAGFGFGETMFQIFIVMASRRLMADRFYTDNYKRTTYTKAGMDWIDAEGYLDKVILRHMPQLKPHLQGVQNAFNPWKP